VQNNQVISKLKSDSMIKNSSNRKLVNFLTDPYEKLIPRENSSWYLDRHNRLGSHVILSEQHRTSQENGMSGL